MRKPCSRVILIRTWSVALIIGFCAWGGDRQEAIPPQPIDICELLKHLPEYRGGVITVTGIYWYGLRESCPGPPLVTGTHTWPTAIDLVTSDFTAKGELSPPFKTNGKSWERFQLFVRQEAGDGDRKEIWVTVTGMLRTPESLLRKDGHIFGGYGHLGGYPAQFVIKEVINFSVKNRPTYDYRELLGRHM